MELNKLDTRKGAEQGIDLEIVDPNGEKTEIVITIRGADSHTYQAKFTEIRRRVNNQLQKMRRDRLPQGDLDAYDIELLAAVTVGWKGIDLDGASFPFSESNAQRLYADYPAIREQVDAAVNDRSNFLPGAAKR